MSVIWRRVHISYLPSRTCYMNLKVPCLERKAIQTIVSEIPSSNNSWDKTNITRWNFKNLEITCFGLEPLGIEKKNLKLRCGKNWYHMTYQKWYHMYTYWEFQVTIDNFLISLISLEWLENFVNISDLSIPINEYTF